jgi:hypothetical protein
MQIGPRRRFLYIRVSDTVLCSRMLLPTMIPVSAEEGPYLVEAVLR